MNVLRTTSASPWGIGLGTVVSLPLDVADAARRLHLIAARCRTHKEAASRAFDFALAVAGRPGRYGT